MIKWSSIDTNHRGIIRVHIRVVWAHRNRHFCGPHGLEHGFHDTHGDIDIMTIVVPCPCHLGEGGRRRRKGIYIYMGVKRM